MQENEHTIQNIAASNLNAKDDLNSMPMVELQAQLQSSPEGLSQVEAQKRVNLLAANATRHPPRTSRDEDVMADLAQ
jgi:hypothetical protein